MHPAGPDEMESPLDVDVDGVDGGNVGFEPGHLAFVRHSRGPVISSQNFAHPCVSTTPGEPRTMVSPWERGSNRRMDGQPSLSRSQI